LAPEERVRIGKIHEYAQNGHFTRKHFAPSNDFDKMPDGAAKAAWRLLSAR
jgi:hypothetical protein